MDSSKIARLIEDLPPETRLRVGHILVQLSHDLSAPLSTIGMEVYSARRLVRGPDAGTTEGLESLHEICTNLGHAASALAEYVTVLSDLGSALESDSH